MSEAALVAALMAIAASPPSTHHAEWTVMVYMNADNNLEPYALANFTDMAKAGIGDAVNVVVQLDRFGHGRYPALAGMPRIPDWSQTLRFNVTEDLVPEPSTALEDLGESNMGDPRTLASFVSWARARFPAKRYALIVWDHGQGFRKLADGSPTGDAFRSSMDAVYRSISHDETDGDELYMSELEEALSTALGGTPLDVVGFDACLMGMVEVGYALRKHARVMVASEELEPGLGWQYDDWLGALKAAPEATDPEALGRMLVDSYRRRWSRPLDGDPRTTLSAVRLGQFDDLARKLSHLSDLLAADLKHAAPAMREARASCRNFAPDYPQPGADAFLHVDLGCVLTHLATCPPSGKIATATQEVRDALASAVIASYAGPARQAGFGASGVAIYFPRTLSEYQRDPYGVGYRKANLKFPVSFVRDQRWADFLPRYLETTR